MKKTALFGSTGSIGRQALEVIKDHPQRFSVAVLACGKNTALLREQIRTFSPELAVVMEKEDMEILAREFPGTRFLYGREGYAAAAASDYDVMINAMTGISGLEPTYEAVRLGRDIALANKETLVAGGALITAEAERSGSRIMPVDSEHSAIYQCLAGSRAEDVDKILLTASGGPFRDLSAGEMEGVTAELALRHPNWTMGPKVTIDSSTMMNKGFEVIEAKWLFGVGLDDIIVLIHPQSIVHSMVRFRDGAVIAQLGVPDMKLPIAYALSAPERLEGVSGELDFFGEASSLTFSKPDTGRFPCLRIATEVCRAGGTYPAVMNGADEILTAAFIEGRTGYTDIPAIISKVLREHDPVSDPGLAEILAADAWARSAARECLGE